MHRFSRSFSCAIQGIVYSIASGRNMKIQLLVAIITMGIAFLLGVNRMEWTFLMIAIFMVLSAETFNTAIERTVDLITEDKQPLAKLAKDLAAGTVLLTAINAVVIGILVFGPYLIRLL
jgi:diacylglycerol kinase